MIYRVRHPGERVGRLTLIRKAERCGRARMWLCRCDCGGEISVRNTAISARKTCSCGCIRAESAARREARRTDRQPFGRVWNYYVRNAKVRKIEWALSRFDFDSLVTASCFYCGNPPQRHSYQGRFAPLVHNGIDRKDNSASYTVENCVPCCTRCNLGKNTMTAQEFIEHARQIARKQGVV